MPLSTTTDKHVTLWDKIIPSFMLFFEGLAKTNTHNRDKKASWGQYLMVHPKIRKTFPKMKTFDKGFDSGLRNGTAPINSPPLWWPAQDLYKISQSECQQEKGRGPRASTPAEELLWVDGCQGKETHLFRNPPQAPLTLPHTGNTNWTL